MKNLLVGLTLIFTVCKLIHIINWSWWLVLTPGIIWIVILLILFILMVIGYILEDM